MVVLVKPNELLNKYKSKYGDSDKIPTKNTKFNNIAVYYDGLNHYAPFNIETIHQNNYH